MREAGERVLRRENHPCASFAEAAPGTDQQGPVGEPVLRDPRFRFVEAGQRCLVASELIVGVAFACLLYTSPSPRDS